MTLHEAIENILMKENSPMKASEIANAINELGLYHRKDGKPVPSAQVLIRVRNYGYLFNYQNGFISLNKNAKNNLKILEDYLFDILNSSKSSGRISNSYFVIAFFLFYKRIANSGDIYGIKFPERINFNYIIEQERPFTDLRSTIINSKAIKDFKEVNPYFKQVANELEKQIRELTDPIIDVILERISSFDFGQSSISKVEFSFFFNNLLRRFAAIQYGFKESTSPINVNKLLSGFFSDVLGKLIDPFAGFAGTLIELKNLNPGIIPFGYEINKTVWALGYMNLFLNTSEFEYQQNDSLRTGLIFSKKYDYLISDLPLNVKFQKNDIYGFDFLNISDSSDSTSIYIQYILSILSENGKAVLLLPTGFLFKSNHRIKKVREVLIKNDWVETIITLPTGILQPYSGISTAILILNKNKNTDKSRRILMVDSEKMTLKRNEIISDEWMDSLYEIYNTFQLPLNLDPVNNFSIVDNLDIIQSDYDFLPRRYTLELSVEDQLEELFKNQPVRLSDVLIKIKTKLTFNLSDKTSLFLAGKNLKNSTVDYTINLNALDSRLPTSQNMYSIDQPALLIQTYFKDLKPSYFEFNGQKIFVTNQIAAFSVNTEKIDVGYLIGQLHEPYFQKQINSIRKGTAQSFFSIKDFLQLKIKLPNLEEQKIYKEKLNEHLLLAKEKEIVQLEVELLKSKDVAIAEQLMIISSIQHDLGNKLPGLKHSFLDIRDFLFQYADKNPAFSLESKIREVLEGENESSIDNLLDVISRVDSILNYTIEMVDDASGIISADPSKYKPQKQKIIKFIKAEISNHYGGHKNIIFEYPEKLDAVVNLDGKQFSKALFNIIDNAIRHGFIEKDKIHHVAFDLISGEENEILVIKNDGLPFPDDFDFEEYKQPYKYFGSTGHTGLGGYIINRVIENHQAEIDLIKDIDSADPYRVKFEIKFPKIML